MRNVVLITNIANNAAVMRLDRAHIADRQAAIALLQRAVQLGDKKATVLLQGLTEPASRAK